VDRLYPGIIRELFDEAFEALKGKYPDFAGRKVVEVRGSYFAKKKRRGGAEDAIDSLSGQTAEDRAAYNLIMKDKERLLSFDESVAFIFSHSALREGWDNPNVCQICTLNQTVSEVKKRQEVGRGMRLVVNQQGQRSFDDKANILTVIANESYEKFVAMLQAEMIKEFGQAGAAPKPVNAREKNIAKRKPLDQLPAEFVTLWEKISPKTRYQVTVDTEKLIADVVEKLDRVKINPPRIVASKVGVTVHNEKDQLDYQLFGHGPLAKVAAHEGPPNIVRVIEDLISHITPPIKLTRKTIAEMVVRTKNRNAALENPQEFAFQAARIIREKAIEQLVDGIQYFKDGTWYDMTEWIEEEETVSDRVVPVDNSIYDHIVVQSETEKRFVEKLKKRTDVRLFVKLPGWFKVRTPVGHYNPDWGLVMEEVDAFGDKGPLMYLIRETKSTTVAAELRGTENQKNHCGERHFVTALGLTTA
jgi:type III restriction enzyme